MNEPTPPPAARDLAAEMSAIQLRDLIAAAAESPELRVLLDRAWSAGWNAGFTDHRELVCGPVIAGRAGGDAPTRSPFQQARQ